MSNNLNTPPTIRWKLLSTVSAVALLASTYSASAAGNDADRPLIWIELGGQMENISGQGEIFPIGFLAANPTSPVLGPTTPLQAQRPPKFSFGEDAVISFQPEGSDWIFSAAIRYGRSSSARHVDHQTTGTHRKYGKTLSPQLMPVADFSDTHARRQESHAILDFLAGKDVGLGMFGRESSSALSLGVRFAQFTSKADLEIRARPDLRVKYYPSANAYTRNPLKYFHTYHNTGHASRSFRGIGPTLSWNGSAPFAGNSQNGEITLDWGVNAAVLFGKQRARVQHQEKGNSETWLYAVTGSPYHLVYHNSGGHISDRSVIVPNVGGSVGISFRKGDAKISIGYRADFFFGAMDAGIDARKSETLGFNGPYASISFGLGD